MDQQELSMDTNGVVDGLPEVVRIEPASACNLRCIHCPTGVIRNSKNRGLMSLETFEAVLKELEDINPRVVVLYHGGEPFLNQNIFYMIEKIKDLGIGFVKTVTNGMLVEEERLRRIILSGLDSIEFSIDGNTAEENNRIRIGSDFDKIASTIKKLIDLKSELSSEIPEIFIANCQIPSIQELERGNPEIPKYLVDEFSEYNNNEINFKVYWSIFWSGMPLETANYYFEESLEDSILNYCEHPHKLITIRHDGNIVACCYDTTSSYVLGNIHESSIRAIWNNELYQELRKNIHHRTPLPLCENCHIINPTRYLLKKT
ncbi:MAG: radical SAM/SPASM domain-containing protein [Candidatus Thorarchaeota archaeon]|jgi:radical SAM protein with 4Fe4S-binding SPASM domain